MKKIAATFLILALLEIAYGQANTVSLGNLPAEVSETSGLLFYDNSLITHNDSGNDAQLFVLDTLTLEITRTVTISNASNTDWEDLAADDNFIYIADIGNNLGNRTDLGIYRIRKTDFDSSDVVMAERISYAYADQSDFSGSANSDWDAEALIILGDSLIVFTKQWQSNGTIAYSLPKTPGDHVAEPLEAYASNGLITGATYNADSRVLFLCGYSQQLIPFVIRVGDLQQPFSFGSDGTRTILPLGFAQVEAITHAGLNAYYLSSERFDNPSPPITLESQLFRFTTEDSEPIDPPVDPPIEPMPVPDDIPDVLLYQAVGSTVLSYEIGLENTLFGRAIYDTSGRQLQYTPAREILGNEVDMAIYGSAIYYISFYFDGRVVSKPFYRR